MNKIFSKVWSKSRGQLVAASELAKSDSAGTTCVDRRKRLGLGVLSVGVAVAISALGVSVPASANTIDTTNPANPAAPSCLSGGSGTVGRLTTGPTSSQATDGSGTYSVVAGCNANGNGMLGVTGYGAFTNLTGNGAAAFGFNATAAQYATALGLETRATGRASTALGFGSNATALNSVAIGGAGGNGTTPLSVANSTTASGAGAVAIGSNAVKGAQATAADTIAIGGQSSASGAAGVAIGLQSSASTSSVALGKSAKAASIGVNGGIAIGQNANASSTGSSNLAIGDNAVASGTTVGLGDSTAIGTGAKSTGQDSTAVGGQTTASGTNTLAVGNNGTTASATGATAFGVKSQATGAYALAAGSSADASGAGAIAVGSNAIAAAKATADNAIAIGGESSVVAAGTSGIAMGRGAVVNGAFGIAQGDGVVSGATGQNVAIGSSGTTANSESAAGGAVAIGRGQMATGDGAVAIGDPNTVNGTGAVALGANNVAAGDASGATAADGAVAIGNANTAIGGGSVALGDGSGALQQGAVAIGATATSNGSHDIAIGASAITSGISGATIDQPDNVAMGFGAAASGGGSVAIGQGTLATGSNTGGNNNATAIGSQAKVNDYNGTALGAAASTGVGASYATAIGSMAKVADDASEAVAIGSGSNANAGRAMAVGSSSEANGYASMALGQGAVSDADTSVALGNLAQASNAGDVAIGSGSTTAAASTGPFTINGGTVAGTDQDNGVVSVGSSEDGQVFQRQIQNVGAGTVSADSTDAVNGSQLYAVGDALNDLGDQVTTNTGDIATNTTNIDGLQQDALQWNPALGAYDASHGSATPQKITNVAAGEVSSTSTDAVNGSQLQAAQAAATTEVLAGTNVASVDKSTAADGHAVYTVNADGASASAGSGAVTVTAGTKDANNVTDYAIDLSQDTKDSLADADSAMQNVVTQVDGTTVKTLDKDDNTANFVSGKNIQLSDDGNGGIEVATKDDVNFNSVQLGSTGPVLTNDGGNLSVGGAKITHVAAGTDATDAVNVSQLDAVSDVANAGWNVSAEANVSGDTGANVAPGGSVDFSSVDGNIEVNRSGTNLTFDLADDIAVRSVTTGNTVMDNSGVTVSGGANPVSLTNSGLDNGGNAITNVAAGSNPTDAVNVSQLQDAQAAATTHYYSVNDGGTQQGNYDNDGATGTNSVAIGTGATASATNAFAAGQGAQAGGANSIAQGKGATTASANDAIAIGNGANVGVANQTGGGTSSPNGAYSIAIGSSAAASNMESVAIGMFSSATGLGATALGTGAEASGSNSVAVGGSTSSGSQSVAMGLGVASGDSSVAIGYRSVAAGRRSSVVGANYGVTGDGSGAFGQGEHSYGAPISTIDGSGSYVLGNRNAVVNDNTFVLGNDVATTQDNSVVLGNASTDRAATEVTGDTINGTAYTYAGPGSAANGVVSVGGEGTERQIINVAAGEVSADSTDAVNGSQLHAVDDAVNDLGDQVTTNTGDIATNTTNIATNTTNIDGLQQDALQWNPTLGAYDASHGSATPQKITNVAAGEVSSTSTDAVNGSQLQAAQAAATTEVLAGTNVASVDKSTAADGHAVYIVNADGAKVTAGDGVEVTSTAAADNVTDYTVGLNQATQDSLAKADSAMQTVVTQVDGTDVKTLDKDDNTANFVSGKNIQLSDDGNGGIEVATKDDVNFNSVQLGSTGPVLTNDGGNLSVGGAKITHVAAGTDATDAVNVSQLDAVSDVANAGWNVSAEANVSGDTGANVAPGGSVDFSSVDGNIEVNRSGTNLTFDLANDIAVGSVTTGNTVMDNGGVTIGGGANPVSLTNSGLDNGGNAITNVAAGSNPTDAVNVSQLTEAAASARTEVQAGTNVASVDQATAADGHAVYTVNADGASASAGSGAVTVTKGTPDADNVTDYAVDLSQATKDSLADADSAMQTVVTQVDGDTVKTLDKDDNTANFVSGNNIQLSDDGNGGIEVATADNVNFQNVTVEGNTVLKGDTTIEGDTTYTGPITGDTNIVNKKYVDDATGDLTSAGLNFTGDAGDTVHQDLGGTLAITGGETDSSKLSSGANIGVTGDDASGTLNIQLAKDLAGLSSVTVGDTVINNAGLTINNGPSITNGGIDAGGSKIINVDAGTDDTDAVNVSQLQDAQAAATTEVLAGTNVASVDKSTAADGHAVYTVNADGAKVTAGDGVEVTSTAAADNVTDYTVGLNQATQDSLAKADSAMQTVVTQVDGTDVKTLDKDDNTANFVSGKNIQLSDDGNGGIEVATKDDVNFNSVQLGSTGPVLTNDGGNLSVGGAKITHVAAGTDATDAVNVSQLDAVGDVANAGWNVSAQGANASNVKPGASVDLNNSDGNIVVSKTDTSNDVTFDLADDIEVDSVSLGSDIRLDTTGLIIVGGPSVTVNGIDAGGLKITHVAPGTDPTDAVNVSQLESVSDSVDQLADNAVQYDDGSKDQVTLGGTTSTDGGKTGGTTITNVHRGEVSADSTDAVNGSQLYETNQNVADNSKTIENIQNGNAGYFQVNDTSGKGKPKATGKDATAGGAGAVASAKDSTALGSGAEAKAGNSVALGAGSMADRADSVSVGVEGGERQITHVAPGTEGTDAVNVNQLNDGMSQVTNWAKNYTDQRFDALGRDLNQVSRRANAGVAAAMAMASLPQAYQPDQSAAAVALGNFHGESAIAVGVSTITDSGHYVFKLNATANTRGDAGVGVGAAIVW